MISLLEIAQSINEADDDKYVSIGFGRFKLKGKEDDDDADVFVKTDSGKYVKSADQKSDDDGGEKPEQPQGGKLGGSDFDRDANKAADDEADDMDRDARFDADAEDDDGEKSAESENEAIIDELEDLVTSSKQKFRYFDVEKEDSEIDDGRYAVVRGDVKDDPDQHMSITAVKDPDGGDIDYSINIGIGGTPIYFGSKEEAMEAAKKLLDDETIRDTMNGDGDPKHTVLADLDQHAANVLLPDDHPDKPLPAQTFDYYRTGKELDNETITINGKQYKPIKEEKKKTNPRVLKEIYDRTFRSLK